MPEKRIRDGAAASAVALSDKLEVDQGGSTFVYGTAEQVAGTLANDCRFLAYNSSTDTNVTGNSVSMVTVDFDTEVEDVGGDFAADTFTAPTTGRYLLSCGVTFANMSIAMNGVSVRIVTSNRTFFSTQNLNVETAGDSWTVYMTVQADMDAGDTAIVQGRITGGAGDTASIVGGAGGMDTWFGGVRMA